MYAYTCSFGKYALLDIQIGNTTPLNIFNKVTGEC